MAKKFNYDEGRRHALVKVGGTEYRLDAPGLEQQVRFENELKKAMDIEVEEDEEDPTVTAFLDHFERLGLPKEAARKIPMYGLEEIAEELAPKKKK